MFKWCSFALAAIVSGILLWMVNDLRLHVRKSVDTVIENLPEILDKTRRSADTIVTLSEDVKQLRELVVGESTPRDSNIVAYANDVLKLVDESGGKIGVKKLLGSGLSDPIPANEWVTRERKGVLWDLARTGSKTELLDRIGHSAVLNRTWYIDTGEKEPQSLVEWIKTNYHPSQESEGVEVKK